MFILIVWKTSDKKLLCIIFSLIYICLDLHNKSDFHKQLCTKVAHFCAKWLHHENLGKIRTYQVPCQPELWKDYPIIEESVKPDRENSRFLYVGFYFTQYCVSRSKMPWRKRLKQLQENENSAGRGCEIFGREGELQMCR